MNLGPLVRDRALIDNSTKKHSSHRDPFHHFRVCVFLPSFLNRARTLARTYLSGKILGSCFFFSPRAASKLGIFLHYGGVGGAWAWVGIRGRGRVVIGWRRGEGKRVSEGGGWVGSKC